MLDSFQKILWVNLDLPVTQEKGSTKDSPLETVLLNERSEWLRRYIDALPDRFRKVILLRFFAEASLDEISEALGCSIGTVKSRLHHALGKLRKMNINANLFKVKGNI